MRQKCTTQRPNTEVLGDGCYLETLYRTNEWNKEGFQWHASSCVSLSLPHSHSLSPLRGGIHKHSRTRTRTYTHKLLLPPSLTHSHIHTHTEKRIFTRQWCKILILAILAIKKKKHFMHNCVLLTFSLFSELAHLIFHFSLFDINSIFQNYLLLSFFPYIFGNFYFFLWRTKIVLLF